MKKCSNSSGRNIWIEATFVTSIADNVKVELRKMVLALVMPAQRTHERHKMEIGRKANYSATACRTG